jgi:hypothetical protein
VSQQVDWRDRFPEDVTCVRCLEVKSVKELDRLLWCEECRTIARRRAAIRGWVAGALVAFLLALYVWFAIQPDPDLIPGVWLALLAASLYLAARAARELFYGWDRLLNRRAVEAKPPAPDQQDDSNHTSNRGR